MAIQTLITAEELLKKMEGEPVELVAGQVVETPLNNSVHSELVLVLGHWLREFLKSHPLGKVYTELGFILARNPDTVRAPDVSFVMKDRIVGIPKTGWVDGPPDLAIEVLSPDQPLRQFEQKIRDFLRAGTRLVWVVDPKKKIVTAHHPSGDSHQYSGNNAVSGEDVLPGFAFCPADLFAEIE